MPDPVKVTVILNRSDNWWDWFSSVRGAARGKKVGDYIDPDLKDGKIIAEPSSPTDPEYTDIGTDVTSIEKVIENKLEGVWKEKNRLYEKEMTKYLLISKNLDAIRTHILETVNRAHTHPLQNADSVRDMIILLRGIYKPDDANRIDDVHNRFQKLSQGPKNVSVEKWIHEWQTLISDAQDVGLPMYAGRGALIAFIKALKIVDYQYADKRHDKIKDGEDLEVFHEMQKFLNEYTEKGKGRNAYATFQGQSDSQTGARNNFTKKTNMDCICGEKHRFS